MNAFASKEANPQETDRTNNSKLNRGIIACLCPTTVVRASAPFLFRTQSWGLLAVGLDLAQLAGFIFYASVVAHVGEQIFAAWIAYKAKAGTRNVVLWSCLVFILGFPALRGLTLLTAGPKGKHGSGKGKEGEKEE